MKPGCCFVNAALPMGSGTSRVVRVCFGPYEQAGGSGAHVPTTTVWPERLTRALQRVTRLLLFCARHMPGAGA